MTVTVPTRRRGTVRNDRGAAGGARPGRAEGGHWQARSHWHLRTDSEHRDSESQSSLTALMMSQSRCHAPHWHSFEYSRCLDWAPKRILHVFQSQIQTRKLHLNTKPQRGCPQYLFQGQSS